MTTSRFESMLLQNSIKDLMLWPVSIDILHSGVCVALTANFAKHQDFTQVPDRALSRTNVGVRHRRLDDRVP